MKKETRGKAKAKKTPRPKFSNTRRPKGKSLEEWQKALRLQAAIQNPLGVVPDGRNKGTYRVMNPINRSEYKVVYRGDGNMWNYCSCMDFRTNQLGTCKHLKAVALWIEKNGKRIYSLPPAYSSVYLSYGPERVVKLRLGSDHRDSLRSLAKDYFDRYGSLKKGKEHALGEFICKAKDIDSNFRIYPDALEFVKSKLNRDYRIKLAAAFNDQTFDNLLKTRLYPYQKEGIRFAFVAGRALIADEMGLGKTIQAIGAAELLFRSGLVSSVLIVCPTSLKYQWKKEIEKFTDSSAFVIEGLHFKRREQYERPEFFKIVSYNAVCNDIKIMKSLNSFDMVIFDEVQRLKNWNTQMARAMRKIDTDYTLALSGTPLENKLEELYSVMQLVDQYRLGPLYRFIDNSIITDDGGKIIGYRNLHDISEKLQPVLLRRTKKQVAIQLPQRMDKILFVPMTEQQMDFHNSCKAAVAKIIHKWRQYKFLSEKDRRRLLLLLSQMRMVCDSTYILDQKTRFDTKVDEIINIVREVVENGDEKVVIFSQWERMTRIIAAELSRQGIGYENLHGGVPSEKRRILTENFSDDPDSRVFLSTDAGSTGLNLQVASIVINVDLPWNPAVLEQRIGRIYRIGQQRNIQVINLVAPDSIEERMLSTLDFKRNLFKGILSDGDDTIFLDDSKLNKIMETIEGFATDDDNQEIPVKSAISDREPDKENDKSLIESIEENDEIIGDEKASDTEGLTIPSPEQQPSQKIIDRQPEEEKETADSGENKSPQRLISDGVSFLSNLSKTLKSPEATKELVDTLVKVDEKTGQTSLNIPVPDKETVSNLFSIIGKLFG